MLKYLTKFLLLFPLFLIFSCNQEPVDVVPFTPNDYSKDKEGPVILNDDMSVNPYKIILNSRSSSNFIKGMFPGSIPSGYSISDFDIQLLIEGEFICDAIAFDFCYIHNKFTATFSRYDVVNNSFIIGLAGNEVDVIAQGTYTLVNSQNQTIEQSFTKYGTASIVARW